MKLFNADRFFSDYGVGIAPPSDSHFMEGWINVRCPFCGDSSYHLGFNTHSGFFSCFRCGWHTTQDVVQAYAGLNIHKAKELIKEYDGYVENQTKRIKTKATECKLPPHTGELQDYHIRYLKRRGFDPEELQGIWGIKGTDHLSTEPFRVIAPIYFDNELVSYQGRTVDKRATLRYKTCASINEVIDHKNIVYGFDQAKGNPSCIVVEGIFDAWRLGTGAVATFGIKFKEEQIRLLTKTFSKVFIMYDPEPVAQKQANKLMAELRFRGISSELLDCPADDPAELSKENVINIRKNIF